MSDTSSFAKVAHDFGCTTEEFSDVLIGNQPKSVLTIGSLDNPSPILVASSTTVSTCVDYPRISKSYTCPCCGTHYIARDPGFVPNCHNCGSIMRCDDL